MSNLEPILFTAIAISISLLVISNFRLRLRNKKLVIQNVQEVLDKNIIAQRLKEELEKKNNVEIEKTDGFLKFISESRDWAFKYIEDVHADFLKFKDKVEPKFEYSNKYLRFSTESAATKILDEIYEAYEEFKRIMPEDNNSQSKD